MRILSPWFVARWLGRMINVHPSLLPAYKGLNTHARALSDGAKIHGCSTHFVTPDMDAGPIIMQAAVPVADADTPTSLADRILRAEHRIYPRALRLVADGRMRFQGDRVTGGPAIEDLATLVSPP